jgi:hypothetical protein
VWWRRQDARSQEGGGGWRAVVSFPLLQRRRSWHSDDG